MPRSRALLCGAVVLLASCTPVHERLPASQMIDGYRAVYRVEEFTPGEVDVRTEVREVGRPFDGRVEIRAGQPPGSDVRAGTVVNRRYQWTLAQGGEVRVGFRRPPGGPVADASYEALRDAAADGSVHALGIGRALGRRCAWFAYAGPTGPLAPPGEAERVESCVGPAGILLRQVWTIGSKVVRTVEATSVTTGVPSDERFLTERKPKTGDGELDQETLVRSAVAVDDDEDPGPLAVRIEVPDGFDEVRSAVVAESGGEGGVPSQTYAQAFVRGAELVVVERSTSPELRPLWSPSEGKRVSLGDLGEGRIVYFVDRVEVRLVGTLGYARIRAPSRETALLFARSLRASVS